MLAAAAEYARWHGAKTEAVDAGAKRAKRAKRAKHGRSMLNRLNPEHAEGSTGSQLSARADLQATDEARTTQSVLLMPLLRAKLGERVRSLREGARHQGSLKSGPLPFRASRN